jgi:glycosyltransferase involved in cell wall biosynthesis
MIKILHLLNTSTFSGAENVVCQIINMFKNDDIEMAYCSLNGKIKDTLKEKDIQFIPVEKMNVFQIKRIIYQYKPDIIHAHDVKTSVIASMCHGKIKLLSTIHSNDIRMRNINVKSLSSLLIIKESSHIFWVSKTCFNQFVFSRLAKQKSSILYNVVDIEEIQRRVVLDTAKYNFNIVYIGRITYQKNPQRLIEIMRIVTDKLPSIKIGVIGTGELEKQTKLLVKQYGIEGNVTFLGYKNNPLKILNDAGVMILTSRWEGTPMVALEALSVGVPIISTPTDGMCEVIRDGFNGYLCDDNMNFAKFIIDVLSNKKLRDKLSQGAISTAKKINNIQQYKEKLGKEYKL